MGVREERDLAWIGDAVLCLYAREWLLEEPAHPLLSRQEQFILFTSNKFLCSVGEPTRVEAEIGHVYRESGLQAAFTHISEHLQPLFIKHLRNLARGRKGQRRK